MQAEEEALYKEEGEDELDPEVLESIAALEAYDASGVHNAAEAEQMITDEELARRLQAEEEDYAYALKVAQSIEFSTESFL